MSDIVERLDAEKLRALDEAATVGPWQGYSEPEVGLPYSLFSGTPMRSGFGPLEPLTGYDIDLVALLRNAVPAILAMAEENKDLRDRLSFWAARQTCDEALADTSPAPWRDCSPEQRLKIISANKELHDGEVLKARRALAKENASA